MLSLPPHIIDPIIARTPKKLRGIGKRVYYFFGAQWVERDALILNTIQKCGTNYVRIFLANYLALLRDGLDCVPVSYKQMAEMFPNERASYLFGSKMKPCSDVIKKQNYSDFVYSHDYRFLDFTRTKVLFVYRNPLDQLISFYYFKYHNRPERAELFDHPGQLIDVILPDFIHHYGFMKELVRKRSNYLMVSYEELMISPLTTFYSILKWARIDVNMQMLARAIERSSFDKVRSEEENDGPIHATDSFTGFFTRSGKIGQWKDTLSDADVAVVAAHLEAAGMSLDEFITEDPRPV